MEERRIYVALDSYDPKLRLPEDTWTSYCDQFTIVTFADEQAYEDMPIFERESGNGRDYFDRTRFVCNHESPTNQFIEGGQAMGYHTFQLEVFRALHNWYRGWRSVFREFDKITQVHVSSYLLHVFHFNVPVAKQLHSRGLIGRNSSDSGRTKR